ncbi:adenosylcobinamide amidohydrolase [Deinococcus roseus]|uniref:Adenosylcobinamide amidohydrolase n=1 Tax=Deinococcus roseus TaxID=392414 RepID=A0ABQ2D0A1_9DEIO|nr:adenosylcobinamide amidohydrolase [Deinococcus roseus]GGJ38281.1 adenosylcobinamide amidohydrolase [Deinococcus roseus]
MQSLETEQVCLTLKPSSLILDFLEPRTVLSSAPFNGGLTRARYVLNRTVGMDFCPVDVQQAVREEIRAVNLPPEQTVCCLTAVDVWKFGEGRAEEQGINVTAFVTAGLGNLSAPGLTPVSDHKPGTINTIVCIEAHLPDAALVEAVQMVTEVKARVLQGRETREGFPGTGTSTDTVTVVMLGGKEEKYSGAVTPVGRAVARAFEDAFREAIK